MPRFTIRGASGVSLYQTVDKDVITIGSSADNDVVVLNARVSARHAEIRREGDEWLLANLASRHGTLLNGQRVTQAAGLAATDEISLGSAVVLIDAPEPKAAASSPETTPRTVRAAPAGAVDHAAPVLVGTSPPMLALKQMIDRVARSNVTLLIHGDSGTGKEIVARLLVERCYREAHRSNRQMARLLRLDDLKQYRKLTAFLRNHDLLIAKGSLPEDP